MQDFLGEELKKNDVIVFIENGYRNFKIGVVDKLTEQLSRAGIKVEHVEVNLSGEDMRRQFMDRRTSWHRPGRSQRMNSTPKVARRIILIGGRMRWLNTMWWLIDM